MMLKEYRYMLDGVEKIFNAVLTYGEGNANMVNVFMSQDLVSISRRYNYNDFGYIKIEGKNEGYYINSEFINGEKSVGTVDYLDEFMNHYVSSLAVQTVEEIVCSCCKKKGFDVSYDNDLIWCKECVLFTKAEKIKLR